MAQEEHVDRTDGAVQTGDTARAALSRFGIASLSAIPDFVYAFDPHRRFVYANPAMLALFGRCADEMLGKTFAELDYPADLADRLDRHIDHVLSYGVTVEDEVFYCSPTGYSAYFHFVWGPIRGEDGSVAFVVGVSRDTTERRSLEEKLRKNEARVRAANELAGLGVYSWDPLTGALEWDDRLRAMWGLPPGAEVNMEVFERGIHPEDLPRVRHAITGSIDPAGSGRYDLEYRVIGREDRLVRHVITSGQATFAQGRAVGFIGAAIDVTEQRCNEAAVRASEALFRSFADNSSNLIWIGDPAEGTIIYRSAAYESIWGAPRTEAPIAFTEWIEDVHPDDRLQVEHAFSAVKAGEVVQFEYRIKRPTDGTIRWLRDTSFPILDEHGAVARIGGITENLTQHEVRQIYLVCTRVMEGRRLARLVREMGYTVRTFSSASALLDLAPVLAPGCVIVDLREARDEGLSIPREFRARSIMLPTIALDGAAPDVGTAVAAMKAGAVDYVASANEPSLQTSLAKAVAECYGAARPSTLNENAAARTARLTPRERDVLVGLLEGGTNKSIGRSLGISPRTVEQHRAQVMNRLNASSLTELLQIALAAGIAPASHACRKQSD